MDGMKYNFGGIDVLVGDIKANVNAVETRLGDLQSKVERLSEVWIGAADEGFQKTKGQWLAAAHDLNSTLKRIELAVADTNLSAQEVEKLNAARW
jgi:WXG100 family type VII secretion target